MPFVVARAPWQTWWAYALYLVLAAGGVAGLVRVRLKAHRRHERELQGLVNARTRELEDANHMLNELSYLDPVTGIGNRRRFQERLDEEWRRAIRAGGVVSLVMVDIDFFKPYNDTFGHQQGDDCLRAIAAALADGLPRSGDAVARWGGEEFAIILPFTLREGAVRLAESLRVKVEGLSIPHPASSVAGVVTISCGVATLPATADVSPSELTRLADESLYVAKHTGRNRTAAEHGAPRRSASRPALPPADPTKPQ
jgi:diguanylate cyclase (GGDEF)-like protein